MVDYLHILIQAHNVDNYTSLILVNNIPADWLLRLLSVYIVFISAIISVDVTELNNY
jgi:hypothetical protein